MLCNTFCYTNFEILDLYIILMNIGGEHYEA